MPKTKIIRVATVGGNNAMGMFTSSSNKRPPSLDDDETVKEEGQKPCHLITALKPLFISMTLVGIFDYWAIAESDRPGVRFRERLLKLYRITVIILCVSNFLRHFPALAGASDFGAELLSSIMVHAIFLHVAISSIVCYKIAENPRKLKHFFALWGKYWRRRANEGSGHNTGEHDMLVICRTLRKACVISLVIGWAVTTGMILFGFYTLYYTDTFQDVISPLSSSHPQAPIAKAVYVAFQFYVGGVWINTAIVMFLVHLTLYYGVRQFAKKIDELKSKTLKEIQDNMEQCRKEHNDWCEMIAVVDDIFQFIAGISLFTYIFCILILVYNMCWYETVRSSPGQLLAHFFWLSGMATMLIILMSVCCLVNNWAHAPANSLYNITFKGLTGDFALQVITFLHRLNGSPIGLSALRLFVIDKTVVVSIGGMLATYFVVLLQFQQSSDTTTAEVNNGTVLL